MISNSFEADASEKLENLEEMFPRYNTHGDVCGKFKYSTSFCYEDSLRLDKTVLNMLAS